MDAETKVYDLVLLGATGYTGKLCAEYITNHLPTDIRWAIAGRSTSKLSELSQYLTSCNPDRQPPYIEMSTLSRDDLHRLTNITRLLINTVGPYHLYSTPVVEACVNNGTHYLDVTGESPWVLEMIEKFHETAKKNHAIIIPEIGIESAPSDMLAWSLATLLRRSCSVGTKEIVATLHEMKTTPSGGTLATALTIFDTYGLKGIARASRPWALSPIPGPKPPKSTSLLTKFFGVRKVPGLGTLTTSIMGATNAAVVQRSWGLIGEGRYYGPRFQYMEYSTVRNTLVGVLAHFALALGVMALAVRPFRWLVRKLVYAPGEGATREDARNEAWEWRAIATADEDSPIPKRAFGRLRYDGATYYLTGLLLAEAAMVILREKQTVGGLGGGVLTPATLGQPFVDRMQQAGIVLETRLIDDR